MLAPTTHPRNGNIWMGWVGRTRSCWKVLQQAQARILPSSGGSQEVLESTLSSCGQESPEHGPGVPRDGA